VEPASEDPGLVSAHDAENNRTDHAEFPTLKINITLLSPKSSLCLNPSPLPAVMDWLRSNL
jgi:hypothetical protein